MFSKFKNKIHKLFDIIRGKYYTYLITQYKYHQLSFSQEGEDRILSRFFERQEKGFYVDVGAHHPQRFSNTYLFYLKGWRGINIDPLPGSMEKFDQLRSNDINLELAISNQNESLTYYQFNEPALNGFSEDLAKERDGLRGEYRIVGKTEIKTYKLAEILTKYLPEGQIIDFLSIDVEGLDLQVLKSNDWQKYRPKMVLAEDLKRISLNKIKESQVVSFMETQGYSLYAKTVNTLFFSQD